MKKNTLWIKKEQLEKLLGLPEGITLSDKGVDGNIGIGINVHDSIKLQLSDIESGIYHDLLYKYKNKYRDVYIEDILRDYPVSNDEIINLLQHIKLNHNSHIFRLALFTYIHKDYITSEIYNVLNKMDFVKLSLSSKKILESKRLVILPQIICSNMNIINFKELSDEIKHDYYYQELVFRYPDAKEHIERLVSALLYSEFTNAIDNRIIEVEPEIICDELLLLFSNKWI